MVEGDPEDVALLEDLDVEPGRQGVDHGGADAVQATGHLVAAAAELAAGVQLGEHQLDRGLALGRVDVGGDAAAVVGDAHAAVGQQRDVDGVGEAGERLVDRVVDDLPDQVVQPALAGGPDVHARALADRLETLEDGDLAGVVVGPGSRAGELGLDHLTGGLGLRGREVLGGAARGSAVSLAVAVGVGRGAGCGGVLVWRVVSLGHGAPSPVAQRTRGVPPGRR